ncbi:hypothetical protein [Pseudonocardia sp.]|uniref:hypothetical protein n=1 Tax=Pseudonocardia sp. TaxID=60912 RepID=UPI002634AE05|nr:hypothetical protein [Pseudonocardia sp.]
MTAALLNLTISVVVATPDVRRARAPQRLTVLEERPRRIIRITAPTTTLAATSMSIGTSRGAVSEIAIGTAPVTAPTATSQARRRTAR